MSRTVIPTHLKVEPTMNLSNGSLMSGCPD